MSSSDRRSSRDEDRKEKRATFDAFWRAFRYLLPYRGMITVSVLCALFVGVAYAGGLGTMLPIMRVLMEGDTLKSWTDREIAARRLDVKLLSQPAREPGGVQLVSEPHRRHVHAGIKKGDRIRAQDVPEDAPVARTLERLADPSVSSLPVVTHDGRQVTLALEPVPWYLAAGRNIAAAMPADPVWAIAAVFGVIFGLAVTSNVVKFFQEYYSDKAAVMAVNDIRRQLYDHVLHVPMAHYGSRGTSDITSRLVQDSQQMEAGFKTVLGQTIQEPIKAATAFTLAMIVSWKLTLFIIVFVPVMGIVIKKFGKKMRRASRAALQNSAHMLGQIEGTLSGIRVVKGASAERFERRRYGGIMRKLIGEQLRMSRIDAFTQPTLETLTLLAFGIIVLVASHMVFRASNPLEKTSFFLVLACLVGIADSLRRVSKVNNVLQRANAAAVRMFEVMDLPREQGRAGAAKRKEPQTNLPPLSREIRFERVTFAYPNAPGPAVDDVSLAVAKGRCVAVVGRNGSGKTTLLALLPRFYDPQDGSVSIDGVDLRNVTLRSLRRQISVVTQDSVIFPGTIAENIAYGHPLAGRLADAAHKDDASIREVRDRVAAAARRAFAHEFILEKPSGYDTVLGEMGGQLSGGQKQRLCIARAIFRQAPILILDEATSQVDAESEHLIQQAIDSLLHEGLDAGGAASAPTTFVIAHRFSTILSADTIVVMDRGRIVGQGRHDQLLETCETYQQLYERQLLAPMPSTAARERESESAAAAATPSAEVAPAAGG